jgi:hypothetical protein
MASVAMISIFLGIFPSTRPFSREMETKDSLNYEEQN